MDETKAASPDAAALRRQLGYITASELYALLGISTGTGWNRQSAGDLPAHYKIGREKLYKLAEVEKWIARRRVQRGA
jgi:predicted DNA-binding transcriptional regulator AlpA